MKESASEASQPQRKSEATPTTRDSDSTSPPKQLNRAQLEKPTMIHYLFLITMLLSAISSNALFLRFKREHAEPVEQQQQEEDDTHPLLRQLGIQHMDLFNEDPSLYVTTGCPAKECKPVSFFVKEIQSDVMDGAECTDESDCEGAYSCRYVDPSEDYSKHLTAKDTGFVCAHHAKVANVCDLPCVERDRASE